jgi:hypothetical protein
MYYDISLHFLNTAVKGSLLVMWRSDWLVYWAYGYTGCARRKKNNILGGRSIGHVQKIIYPNMCPILYMYFWVVFCRRSETLCQVHRVFPRRQSESREIPKRTYTRFRTRPKFEIKNVSYSQCFFFVGERRGTRTRKHFVNLTRESENFKLLEFPQNQL